MAHYWNEIKSIKNSPLALSLGIGTLLLSILGARLQVPSLTMAMIIVICVILALAAFKKIKKETFPFLVYVVGLALVFQTTLLSNSLIGTDIHSEFYFAQLTETNGFWDWTLPHSYNSAIASVFLLPAIGKVMGIGTLWAFKVIAPIFFAFVPFLIYYIFRSQFRTKVAFFSAMFFVLMPAYAMEVASITRQQSAELMFTIMLAVIVIGKFGLKVKVPTLIGLSSLAIMFHYSLFLIILAYFAIAVLILIGFKNRTIPLKWMLATVGILLMVGIGYFGTVSSGIPLKSMEWLGQSQIYRVTQNLGKQFNPPVAPWVEEPTSDPLRPSSLPAEINTAYIAQANRPTTFNDHESMMKTALGMDIAEASPLGKGFRILQGITQALLVLGTILLIIRRKRLSPEYFAFCMGSVVILFLCFALPSFSAMLNASRFYHIALILLSPAIIIGGLFIVKKHEILTLAVIIPYFLISSGFVFEASKSTAIDKLDVPFSTALSYQRVDLGGVFTENDLAVRDYAWEHKLLPIYGDLYGELALEESYGLDGWGEGLMYLPFAGGLLQSEDQPILPAPYIFLRERNTQTQTVTFWHEPGLRKSYGYDEFGMTEELENRPIIYQEGDAIIYGERQNVN